MAGPPVPGESAAPGRPPIPVTGPRVRADPPSRPSPSFHAYTYARAYVTIHMLPHTHRICSHIFPPSLILPQSDHAIWQSVSRVSDTARRQSPITQSRMIPPVRRFRHPGHQSCLTPSGRQSCHRSVGRSSHHTGRAATHAGHHSCLTPSGSQSCHRSVGRSGHHTSRAATHAGHHSCLTPSGSQSCHRSIGRSGHHAGRAALIQVISHVSCRQAVSHVTGRSVGRGPRTGRAATHSDPHSCIISQSSARPITCQLGATVRLAHHHPLPPTAAISIRQGQRGASSHPTRSVPESVTQSLGQSVVSPSVSPSASHSFSQAVRQSVCQSVSQSVSQSDSPSVG